MSTIEIIRQRAKTVLKKMGDSTLAEHQTKSGGIAVEGVLRTPHAKPTIGKMMVASANNPTFTIIAENSELFARGESWNILDNKYSVVLVKPDARKVLCVIELKQEAKNA